MWLRQGEGSTRAGLPMPRSDCCGPHSAGHRQQPLLYISSQSDAVLPGGLAAPVLYCGIGLSVAPGSETVRCG